MEFRRIKKIIQFDTAGWIAISSMLLCGLSGFLLAIPYDNSRAYESILEMLLFNPAGNLVRNFHYWSSQLFFISILIHLYDHFSKSTESNIKNYRTWLILCISLVFLGYEMLSGFILKGDGAGLQAERIFASLLESIPVAGKILVSAFAGREDHWQMVYVQHLATGTIILFIGTYEHVKNIWPKLKSIVIVFAGLLLISLFFRAPLGFTGSNQITGPWFFLGIQELLHWTSEPRYLLLLFFVSFFLLIFLPKLGIKGIKILKRMFFAGGILYLGLTLLVFFFRGNDWQWKNSSEVGSISEAAFIYDPVDFSLPKSMLVLSDKVKTEGCLVCHSAMKGLSDSHQPASTGCFACHRGDPFSSDKLKAHKNMILVPGNFSNVRQTCGTQNCHREISERILSSLMNTAGGIVRTDRKVFGEAISQKDSDQVENIGHSAADNHLRNLCAGCHLGIEKRETGNATWLDRGGGCNACHLQYNPGAISSLKKMRSKDPLMTAEIHPAIDIQVSNDRCKSCHSRSGRISLSYEGWNEINLKPSDLSDSVHFKILPDDRVVEFVQDDVHHQKGMNCIDCHGSYETMGDGQHPLHEEDAVKVQCIDCHPGNIPETFMLGNLPDRESQMIAGLRKYRPDTRVVLTADGNRPLVNTLVDSLNRIFLTNKLTGEIQESKHISPACYKGKGHQRLACESCHTAWVPQCIGCHNSYEKSTIGIDMLTGKPTSGSWIEYAGKNFGEPPTLGVKVDGRKQIVPAMPGMILTIDKETFAKGKGSCFLRLFAPASGHTTQRIGRSCKSCHNDPLAIGYGRGVLKFKAPGSIGKWTFEPRFAQNGNDQLPEDAWTGFLQEAKAPWSTRTGLRPFTVGEQRRILEVGSCLTCHEDKSRVMELALEDFQQALNKRCKFCLKQH